MNCVSIMYIIKIEVLLICFANKGVNHRRRKSPSGIPRASPRFVFQFAWATANHFLRKTNETCEVELWWLLLLADIYRLQNVEVSYCDRFCLRNFIVWSLDMSGGFHQTAGLHPMLWNHHAFSSLLLSHTKRETWGNWKMIHANPWVSFGTGTSRLNRHTHDLTVEDWKQELAIFSITIIVPGLGVSFTFAWQKIKVLMVSLNNALIFQTWGFWFDIFRPSLICLLFLSAI